MLTVREIDTAKPKAKPYKIADGDGLYIEVLPTGAKYWRLKYRMEGKEKGLAFGVYPEVRPAKARDMAKAARDLIRAGTDSGEEMKRVCYCAWQ